MNTLIDVLSGLVPLHIAELRGLNYDQRQQRVSGAADLIATKADQMMYGDRRQGKPSGVLSAVAGALAVLAYQPGGVTWSGVHICAYPHPGCPADARRPPCCSCGNTCDGGCAWCANGCPVADTSAACCMPVPVVGRFVFVRPESDT